MGHRIESCEGINPEYTIFTTIDCTRAYNQVRIHKDDEHLTTIVTQAGRYYYNTLSQGITSSSHLWNMLTDGLSRLDS